MKKAIIASLLSMTLTSQAQALDLFLTKIQPNHPQVKECTSQENPNFTIKPYRNGSLITVSNMKGYSQAIETMFACNRKDLTDTLVYITNITAHNADGTLTTINDELASPKHLRIRYNKPLAIFPSVTTAKESKLVKQLLETQNSTTYFLQEIPRKAPYTKANLYTLEGELIQE